LAKAVQAFTSNKMSLRQAAGMYGVNKDKLWRVVNGIQAPASKVGRPTALDPKVEDILVEKLSHLISNHFYLEMVQLPLLVRDIYKQVGHKCPAFVAGRKWVDGFLNRHPELSARKSGKISRARRLNFNPITHAQWYAAVGEFIGLYKPEEIFNVDDSGYVPHRAIFGSWSLCRPVSSPCTLPMTFPDPFSCAAWTWRRLMARCWPSRAVSSLARS
jgi:hypothetical protein